MVEIAFYLMSKKSEKRGRKGGGVERKRSHSILGLGRERFQPDSRNKESRGSVWARRRTWLRPLVKLAWTSWRGEWNRRSASELRVRQAQATSFPVDAPEPFHILLKDCLSVSQDELSFNKYCNIHFLILAKECILACLYSFCTSLR